MAKEKQPETANKQPLNVLEQGIEINSNYTSTNLKISKVY
jgi:hypothetical protein